MPLGLISPRLPFTPWESVFTIFVHEKTSLQIPELPCRMHAFGLVLRKTSITRGPASISETSCAAPLTAYVIFDAAERERRCTLPATSRAGAGERDAVIRSFPSVMDSPTGTLKAGRWIEFQDFAERFDTRPQCNVIFPVLLSNGW